MKTSSRRVIVIERTGGIPIPQVVNKGKEKVSAAGRPGNTLIKGLSKAQSVFAAEVLRRQSQANRRQRDGWLLEAPSIFFNAQRKAYNTARKELSLNFLPKL